MEQKSNSRRTDFNYFLNGFGNKKKSWFPSLRLPSFDKEDTKPLLRWERGCAVSLATTYNSNGFEFWPKIFVLNFHICLYQVMTFLQPNQIGRNNNTLVYYCVHCVVQQLKYTFQHNNCSKLNLLIYFWFIFILATLFYTFEFIFSLSMKMFSKYVVVGAKYPIITLK